MYGLGNYAKGVVRDVREQGVAYIEARYGSVEYYVLRVWFLPIKEWEDVQEAIYR